MPKQKFRLNPTGIKLDESNCSKGMNLIMKMGYKEGQGLGKDQKGILNPIKPCGNYNNLGLGAVDKVADPSFQQLDDFSALLSKLQSKKVGESGSPSAVKMSIEDKSKNSKNRLHYAKFVRSKDVSKFDSKMLTAILGFEKEPEKPKAEEIKSEPQYLPQTFTSTLSMSDYFKKRSISKMTPNTETTNETSSELQTKAELVGVEENNLEESLSKKERKRLQKELIQQCQKVINQGPDTANDSPSIEDDSTEALESKKETKKRKKEQTSDVETEKEIIVVEEIGSEESLGKKKSKKRRKEKTSEIQEDVLKEKTEEIASTESLDNMAPVITEKENLSKKELKRLRKELTCQDQNGVADEESLPAEKNDAQCPEQKKRKESSEEVEERTQEQDQGWKMFLGKKKLDIEPQPEEEEVAGDKKDGVEGQVVEKADSKMVQYATRKGTQRVDLAETCWASTNLHLIKGYEFY